MEITEHALNTHHSSIEQVELYDMSRWMRHEPALTKEGGQKHM